MNRPPIESDAPRAVDEAFAALLQRLDPNTDPRVLHAARRAMQAVAQGHAALDLHELAREPRDGAGDHDALEPWRSALQASPWVATPDIDAAAPPDAPLVLERDLLYLRRYREYERRLALGLRRIAAQPLATDSQSVGPEILDNPQDIRPEAEPFQTESKSVGPERSAAGAKSKGASRQEHPSTPALRAYAQDERNSRAHLNDSIAALAPLFAQLFPAAASAPITSLSGPAQRGARSDDPRGGAAQAPVPHAPPVGEGQEPRNLELFPLPAPERDKPTSPARGRGRAAGAGEGALRASTSHSASRTAAPISPPAEEGRNEGAFPDADQPRAAALALVRNLLLITGGPGTGKTTTLARMLVLLIAQHRALDDSPPRIALAAPTGRAAERMAQSIAQARDALHAAGVDATLLDALPTQARTLHRLLGPIPDRPRFRHDAAHPLAYDVVVVDEASMVDLPLMCKLVEAVPDGALLVLVGDPDQLPSVEAGDVLASIVQAAGDGTRLAPEDAKALRPLLGDGVHDAGAHDADAHDADTHAHDRPSPRHPREGGGPRTSTEQATTSIGSRPRLRWGQALRGNDEQMQTPTPFAHHRVHLRHGWRQSEALDLAPLADAVRAGNGERVLALLQDQSLRGVTFHPGLSDPLAAATREPLLATWRALADAHDPRAALDQAARLRLLTAVRAGPQGAVQLNARIEEALAGTQRDRYFHGRLLLITENSYRHGLFNGDIGVCLRDTGGALVAWFANGSDVRGFHPGTLPAHEGAFAMTVHKAQGSEFDAVWLLLPTRPNRVLSRELIYTGITRARRELHVAGSAEVIEAALARQVGRWSGLGWRLSS
jgi:exodeoxyribonuclease V alpha subunit